MEKENIAKNVIHIYKLAKARATYSYAYLNSSKTKGQEGLAPVLLPSYILQFCLIFKFPKCAFKANFESSKIFEMVEPFREEPTQRSKVTVTNIYLKLG